MSRLYFVIIFHRFWSPVHVIFVTFSWNSYSSSKWLSRPFINVPVPLAWPTLPFLSHNMIVITTLVCLHAYVHTSSTMGLAYTPGNLCPAQCRGLFRQFCSINFRVCLPGRRSEAAVVVLDMRDRFLCSSPGKLSTIAVFTQNGTHENQNFATQVSRLFQLLVNKSIPPADKNWNARYWTQKFWWTHGRFLHLRGWTGLHFTGWYRTSPKSTTTQDQRRKEKVSIKIFKYTDS